MDLSKISQKLEAKFYTNFNELEDDFRLIVTNCERYNGQFNGFTTNAYAIWRLFRKQTKKYLDHDLSLEDKDAFLYPPRYSFCTTNKSNIGKRKKRKKQKKSTRYLALELLYNATQDSIESTFNNFAFSPMSMSDNENKNDNFPKKYQFSDKQNDVKNEKQSDDFYDPQSTNHGNYSYQDGFYTDKTRSENLEFKSLNEWNKLIDESGKKTVLPDKAVIVKNSPVDSNWLTNFQNDQIHYKTVFNKFLHEEPQNGILENGCLVLNKNALNAKEPKNRKSKENSKNTDNKIRKRSKNSESLSLDDIKIEEEDESLQNPQQRFVIKLSKLNNWDSSKFNNQESGSESDSSSDSSSSCSSDSDN